MPEPHSPVLLSTLAERAASGDAWWNNGPDHRSPLQLPTRVLHILDNAGIRTVDDLKAAGPHRLRSLEGIGKLGFEQCVELLRELDREGGATTDYQYQGSER